MKKHVLAITFLILIAAGGAFAQTVEQQVAKIRQITAETNREIDAGDLAKADGEMNSAKSLRDTFARMFTDE